MIVELILFILGFILIVKGADLLVDGASSLAKKLGIPPLIIGLTIVAFGTSLPELIVNVFSAIQGSTDIAVGNILGSNLANILLILGATAIIFPLIVESETVWKQIPFSFLAAIVLLVVANDAFLNGNGLSSVISRGDGIILLLFFVIFVYYAFELARSKRQELKEGEVIPARKMEIVFLMIIGGLIGLYFGGHWIVDGAIVIAQHFGMSEFMISTTIIAFGTSLPELVTSVMAAFKKKLDLAVGNIIGSNIFNIFLVLGVTSVISPIKLMSYMNLDIFLVLAITFLLFLFVFIAKERRLEKWHGILFVLLYVGYIVMTLLRG